MQEPYIYQTGVVDSTFPISFDNEIGVKCNQVSGHHIIWAARVPFLPTLMSEDFTRLGNQRISLIMQRQFRFIYDLTRAKDHNSTFELRYISTPNPVPGQPNIINIIFIGKIFATDVHRGKELSLRLWDKFLSNFPIEEPFVYPLIPITSEEEFLRFYQPLVFEEIRQDQILEIRKYEDMPIQSMAPLGRVSRKGDYIAHPFVPNTDFSPMGRFITALSQQPQKCFVGISLRPTRMFDQEIHNVSFAIGQFKRTAVEDDDVTEEYIRTRSKIGVYVYQQLMQEREQLVMIRVHLVGEKYAPRGLAEALGSEMMGNAANEYPTQWALVQPGDEKEYRTALRNIQYLEQDDWGYSIAAPPLKRLRYFATAREAYGAFRLPVPPESGYLPGLLVKDEPFVAPSDELELRRRAEANLDDILETSQEFHSQKKISLGDVYHRGNPTRQEFQIKVRDLTRHMLIGGSTGSGKSTTVKHILSQLWIRYKVPFLVLYPIDKPDYRDLFGFRKIKDNLLVFTLGDESVSPFRFNPFEVPEGILLKTHISRLMRVFDAAFALEGPLPMIYREALRKVYREKGWDIVLDKGQRDKEYPIMSEFYEAIKETTEQLNYGREVQDNVRQASVIRIGDLLENAGHVVNVRQSMPLSIIMQVPTIMEIGRVGSSEDTTLLMGFLIMRFAEEIEKNPRPGDSPHIMVVEEAHRLMKEVAPSALGNNSQNSAGEDFSNILAEVRGYGEGIIIAEQIPTLLVKGAIGNTYIKLMHWLEDQPSFTLFDDIMNLNMSQKEYARTLTPGFAVVRSPFGRPVHVKIPEFGDQEGYDNQFSSVDDAQLKDIMAQRRQELALETENVIPWNISLSASGEERIWRAPERAISWLMSAPMQTCGFCEGLHKTGKCLYRYQVGKRILNSPDLPEWQQAVHKMLAQSDKAQLWDDFQAFRESLLETKFRYISPEERKGLFYCYLAHEVNESLSNPNDPEKALERKNGRVVLQQFMQQFRES